MDAAAEEDFRAYVAARTPALLRTAGLLTGNWATAEDLVQTALARAYLAWPRIRDRAAVDAYCRRILVNTYTSWWRRRWRAETPTADPPDRAAPESYDRLESADPLRVALDRLPRRMRAVVVLRYFEDLPDPQIADLLGCTVGTVRSQAHRALAKLRADDALAGLVREEAT